MLFESCRKIHQTTHLFLHQFWLPVTQNVFSSTNHDFRNGQTFCILNIWQYTTKLTGVLKCHIVDDTVNAGYSKTDLGYSQNWLLLCDAEPLGCDSFVGVSHVENVSNDLELQSERDVQLKNGIASCTCEAVCSVEWQGRIASNNYNISPINVNFNCDIFAKRSRWIEETESNVARRWCEDDLEGAIGDANGGWTSQALVGKCTCNVQSHIGTARHGSKMGLLKWIATAAWM